MSSTDFAHSRDRLVPEETRRANPAGAYLATVGALVFLGSSFVDWLDVGGGGGTGHPLDSPIPFAGYLGVGLALALLYACKRATRRQHRGLSLTSMAAGFAAAALAVSYWVDAPGSASVGSGWDDDLGIYVGLAGALVWALGSYLLAKEPEGDIEHDRHDSLGHYSTRADTGH